MRATVGQAAEMAGIGVDGVRAAIRRGDLVASRNARGGVFIERAELDRWIELRFLKAGGTDDPTKMTMREACERARCVINVLYHAIKRGKLTEHRNGAGKRILDREEFEEWVAGLDPLVEDLDPSVRWYTVAEVAKLVNLAPGSVHSDIARNKLPSTICRPTLKRYISESDIHEWIRKREALYPQAPLDGKPMLINKEAAESFNTSVETLRSAVRRGFLPDHRRFTGTSPKQVVGARDVEKFLADYQSEDAWTVTRIVEWVGVSRGPVYKAVEEGMLPLRTERHPLHGPRRVVDPGDLLSWLATDPVSYCSEAAHLSCLADAEEAAKLSGLSLETVQEAMARGDLVALNGSLSRYDLDRWLEAQGLPPSWQHPAEQEWLRLSEAAELVNMSTAGLKAWIRKGHLPARKKGRRFLLQRKVLLETVARRRPADKVTLGEAARELKVSFDRLRAAVRRGELAVEKVGRFFMVRPEDVQVWWDAGGSIPRKMLTPEGFLTLTEVAQRLQMSNDSASHILREGLLPAQRTTRRWLVAEKDLEVFLAERDSRE